MIKLYNRIFDGRITNSGMYQALIKIVFHIQWNWHNPQHYQIDDLDSRLNWNEIIVLYRKYECHIHKQNRKKPDYHQRLWFGEINKKKVLIFLKRIYLSLGNFSTIISPQTRTYLGKKTIIIIIKFYNSIHIFFTISFIDFIKIIINSLKTHAEFPYYHYTNLDSEIWKFETK